MSGLIRKIFRWRNEPPAPLTPEELMDLKIAFRTCGGDCPMAILFRSMMNHIEWQDRHLKVRREYHDYG